MEVDSKGKDRKGEFWRDPRPTNENPNFVHDYFASSRLHFIGSFRARYESMMVAVGKKLGVDPALLIQSSVRQESSIPKKNVHERVIAHIDMDCFFASIAMTKDPSLKGKCIAVSHGGGEISSCSYEARKFGVHAGMFCKDARKICPDLISVPYDFPTYEQISIQIYSRFYRCPGVIVEAVSVDEAYLDLTYAIGEDVDGSQTGADSLIRNMRSCIFQETGCTASAGIGPSKLIARLATKGAKPNGQLRLRQQHTIEYLDTLQVKDLPGIGWRTSRRLAEKGIKTCLQLRAVSISELQAEFGERQGQIFFDLARGLDSRPVESLKPRKSIGAEASWGVRFLADEGEKAKKFIMDMADEVSSRVLAAGAYGTKAIFKVYRRKPDADSKGWYKFLGHGPCTVLTRSSKLPVNLGETALKQALRDLCLRLHSDLNVCNEDFRGVGLQVTDLTFSDLKFDHTSGPTKGDTRRIESFFSTAPPPTGTTLDSKIFSAVLPVEDKSHENGAVVDGLGSRVDIDPVALGFVEQDKDSSVDGDCVPIDDAVVKTRISHEIEEDRIEIGRAEDQKRTPAPTAEQEDIEIPEGWDQSVFQALPDEIRLELIKEHCSKDGFTAVTGSDDEVSVEVVENFPQPSRNKRNRAADDQSVLEVQPEKKIRKSEAAQITMTQFVAVSRLKQRGNDVLGAEEFRSRPLGECIRLLEDFNHKNLSTKNAGSVNGAAARRSRSGASQGGQEFAGEGLMEAEEKDDWDIPSPPSLSSDADTENEMMSAVARDGCRHEQIYEDEELTDYAAKLKLWMISNAQDIKSGHIELLRGRILELVKMKRLERLCAEMRTIRTFAEEDKHGLWRFYFNDLVDDVQNECQQLYGFRLRLTKICDSC